MSDRQTAAMLDKKLDEKTAHNMFVCGIVMVVAVLIHDAESHCVHLPRNHDLSRQIPPYVRYARRGDRRHLYAGILSGPSSLWVGHRSVGRMEFLLLCTDERRHLSGKLLSGSGLAELGAAFSYGTLLRTLCRDRFQALERAEKGSESWLVPNPLFSAVAVKYPEMRRRI